MHTSRKFILLACLYFSQGMPYGFFSQALPAILRERDMSLTHIGLTYLLLLPWALKFLWAPLVDELGIPGFGHRKTWLVAAQVLTVTVLLYLGLYAGLDDGGGTSLLFWGFFLANLLAATQDIATDGMAVNLLSPEERGIGNGIQVAGYRLGMIVGGGVLLSFFGSLGWRGIFLFMAGLLVLSTLPALSWREPGAASGRTREGYWEIFSHVWRKPGFPVWLGLIAFYKFGEAMATGMLTPFLSDLGMNMVDIAEVTGKWGFVGGLLGSLLGGFLVTLMGRYIALLVLGLLQTISVGGYVALADGWLSLDLLNWVVCWEHFAAGMATAALFTVMMDVCDGTTASSDYTLQASAVVIATGIAKTLSGLVADYHGYGFTFQTSMVLTLLGVVAFAILARRWVRAGGRIALIGPAVSH
ncbi:MFS transporter [Sulfidibacter corallicola]|uniref:MFS transporter n=1 Tax=Sulfidibacter corallicola TaxID=2818388 RepID=A0A8A4TI39_SULCO|nr:MFS transporter [Sulfidibacter corallicola]QTD49709.1 MFS transporter [Sulfidibacter corallicola]